MLRYLLPNVRFSQSSCPIDLYRLQSGRLLILYITEDLVDGLTMLDFDRDARYNTWVLTIRFPIGEKTLPIRCQG